MCWILPSIVRQHRNQPASPGLSDRALYAVERIDRAAAEINAALADIRQPQRREDDGR